MGLQERLGLFCTLIQLGPVCQRPQNLHPEGAGPSHQPLGGLERCQRFAAPPGVENRLILRACWPHPSGDTERTVRNQLGRAAPERQSTLLPLRIAGIFRQLQKRQYIVEGLLVDGVVAVDLSLIHI